MKRIFLILLSVLFSVLSFVTWNNAQTTRQRVPDSSIYGFENGTMGWEAQTYRDSRAIDSVAQSERGVARRGSYALKLFVNLSCGNQNLSKGETFVDVASDTMLGTVGPKNLMNRRISCWIKAPWEAVGEWSNRNGIQLFSKDLQNRGQYSEWHTIAGDEWIEITYSPCTNPTIQQRERGMWTEQGFDPTRIIYVGVKIGCGSSSAARFRGPVYLDCVTWPR
jgi:hypothetical protein